MLRLPAQSCGRQQLCVDGAVCVVRTSSFHAALREGPKLKAYHANLGGLADGHVGAVTHSTPFVHHLRGITSAACCTDFAQDPPSCSRGPAGRPRVLQRAPTLLAPFAMRQSLGRPDIAGCADTFGYVGAAAAEAALAACWIDDALQAHCARGSRTSLSHLQEILDCLHAKGYVGAPRALHGYQSGRCNRLVARTSMTAPPPLGFE